MQHYIDLRVRPDPEFSTSQLLNALAAKLHRALVTLNTDDIGVSFPHHQTNAPSLGHTLRLHSSMPRLQELMRTNWLTGMTDHLIATEVRTIPTEVAHRVVRRVQAHSNVERVRRRQIKRHGWTTEEARQRIPDTAEQRLHLPWLTLRSVSTQQSFRLFIEHLPCQAEAMPGRFNAYGLSAAATIPWF